MLKTRWPVSAAFMAMSIVSLSRISPTRMTSGSCRSAALRAFAKLSVSEPSSLWMIVDFLSLCKNSMGSSIVTILGRFLLIDVIDHGGKRGLIFRSR